MQLVTLRGSQIALTPSARTAHLWQHVGRKCRCDRQKRMDADRISSIRANYDQLADEYCVDLSTSFNKSRLTANCSIVSPVKLQAVAKCAIWAVGRVTSSAIFAALARAFRSGSFSGKCWKRLAN